ncbi:MAG: hypothetical protein AB9846_04350 [Tenuifilaceae bacterium]
MKKALIVAICSLLLLSCKKDESINVTGKIDIKVFLTSPLTSRANVTYNIYVINIENEDYYLNNLEWNRTNEGYKITLTSEDLLYGTYKVVINLTATVGLDYYYNNTQQIVQVIPDKTTSINITF